MLFDLTLDRSLDRSLDLTHHDIDLDRSLDCTLELARDIDNFDFDFDLDFERDLGFDRYFDLVLDLARAKEIGDERLYQRLQSLKGRFPSPNRDRNAFQTWWIQNGKKWIAEYRQVIIEHRNIGHDWKFTNEQREKLEQYYEANELLVECLKSDCYVRRETRQEIEESLLMPSVSSKR